MRFQTFNASLNRTTAGELVADLSTPDDPQAPTVAETIQRTRPDVLLINEFDYVPGGQAVDLFRDNYLEVGHNGAAPIHYPYAFIAPSNTGVPWGSTSTTTAPSAAATTPSGSASSRAVRHGRPLATRSTSSARRTFQKFRWADMPGAISPTTRPPPRPPTGTRPRSSRSAALLASRTGTCRSGSAAAVHFLVSHPTPPVFDGAEDRNGPRNYDEIRSGPTTCARRRRYVYDDGGRYGGLRQGAAFVIAGDQNSDPLDGDSIPGAIQQLLENPRVNHPPADPRPASAEAAALQGGANAHPPHRPPPTTRRTSPTGAGEPARRLRAASKFAADRRRAASVLAATQADPSTGSPAAFPFVPTSDHRSVWLDVRLR